jgi:hypothetical protein
MSTADKYVTAVGALASLAAGGFWLWASLLHVPDNQDTFIAALQLISRINAFATMCATAAALCVAYGFLKSLLG